MEFDCLDSILAYILDDEDKTRAIICETDEEVDRVVTVIQENFPGLTASLDGTGRSVFVDRPSQTIMADDGKNGYDLRYNNIRRLFECEDYG